MLKRNFPKAPGRIRKQREVVMNRQQIAVKQFEAGFNCAQSVLLAFALELGLPEELASKLAQAFGGGMALMGDACGAVIGGLMVIGLKYGKVKPEDASAREKTYSLAREFFRSFRTRHGSLLCRELLGVDLSQEGGYERAAAQGLFKTVCPDLISSSIRILEDLI